MSINYLIRLYLEFQLANGPKICKLKALWALIKAHNARYYIVSSNYRFQSSVVFDLLKAHLKRAPSLRGAALVRLASLKFQAEPWPPLLINKTEALARLDEVSVGQDRLQLPSLEVRRILAGKLDFKISSIERRFSCFDQLKYSRLVFEMIPMRTLFLPGSTRLIHVPSLTLIYSWK